MPKNKYKIVNENIRRLESQSIDIGNILNSLSPPDDFPKKFTIPPQVPGSNPYRMNLRSELNDLIEAFTPYKPLYFQEKDEEIKQQIKFQRQLKELILEELRNAQK